MSEQPKVADYPTSAAGWLERIEQIAEEELTPQVVNSAYAGNATAQGTIRALVVELQAAAIYLATYSGALLATQEAMIEVVNTIIDTLQAILLAIGIIYLLKKVKKKGKKTQIDIEITLEEAKKIAGDKAKPRPSVPDSKDDDLNRTLLLWRLQWTTHFIKTMMLGIATQEEADGQELEWVSRKDSNVCTICRYMDGKVSKDGDFLPIILDKFKDYVAYVPFMPWPHVHPRCRCRAVPVED